MLKAPPGTVLHQKMKDKKRLKQRMNYSESHTNIIPVMSETVLYKGYAELLAEVYRPSASYERIINFLNNYKLPQSNERRGKIFLERGYLFFKIIYRIGLKSKVRKYFWKLLLKTLFKNYKLTKIAVAHGIMIHQMHLTSKFIISEIPTNRKIA